MQHPLPHLVAAVGAPLAAALEQRLDRRRQGFLPALAAVGFSSTFDLRRADQDQTAELLRDGTVMTIDVALFWQQWRLRSPALERVADAVRRAAATTLH